MKASAIIVGVASAFAAAQGTTFPQGFPQCGVTCVNNMLQQASDLGCGNDVTPTCLCTKQNFLYGVRDCATESCQDQNLAQQVIAYGSQYCADAGVSIPGLPASSGTNHPASSTIVATSSPTNGSDSQGPGNTVVPIATSEILSTVTNSDGSVFTSTVGTTTLETTQGSASGTGVGVLIPISTATIESTITNSEGVATSAVATSTIFSLSGGSSGTESGSATTGVTESLLTSNGSTLAISVTTTGPASGETSEGMGSEPTSSEGSQGSHETSSTSNPAAQRTAAPVGFIAAAGLAALLL
ncbi:hypothetical protein AAE478_006117 [Parahypoxylon ruwenzoriense]